MNDNLESLFQADAEEKQKLFNDLSDKGLSIVAILAKRIQNVEENLVKSENLVKQYKKELLKLTDEELPQHLAEMGLSSIKLEDGSKVDVKKTYGGSKRQ